MHDPLGDRLKTFERLSEGDAFDKNKPVCARVDGRGFSKFTDGMRRPFDDRMTSVMRQAAEHLLLRTHAKAAYVQSDEISLAWDAAPTDGEHFFGGRPMKMASVLAGEATAGFLKALMDARSGLAEFADRLPHFDARVAELPARTVVADMFSWRGQDAKRNSLNQVAQSLFKPSDLKGKSTREVKDMLAQRGVEPSDYPEASLNGTLMFRRKVERTLSAEELARIPSFIRPKADKTFLRSEVQHYVAAHPGRITNLVDVIFEDAEPSLERSQSVPA
jgi:tRNA(His) guanylyltransferase